jgi:hypothetical protein
MTGAAPRLRGGGKGFGILLLGGLRLVPMIGGSFPPPLVISSIVMSGMQPLPEEALHYQYPDFLSRALQQNAPHFAKERAGR